MSDLFRIRPLEWEWFETFNVRGYRVWVEVAGKWLKVFQTFDSLNNCWRDGWALALPVGTNPPDCAASPEDGKQIAEQHWRNYISQALIPVEE